MINNLYNTLIKLLIKYLLIIIHDEFDADFIGKILNTDVKKYLFDTMPKQIVKIILKQYTNKSDPDRKIKLVDIFTQLTELLVENLNKNSISETRKFEEQLRTYVYPYYSGYFETVIKEMKNTIDMFLKSIQYNNKLLKVYELILH